MTRTPLRSVPDEPAPIDWGPDIYAALKAKRQAIDWAACHIAADRREPVQIDDVRRGWRG